MKINSRGIVTVAAMAVVIVTTGCKKKDAAVADTSAMMPPPAPEAPAKLHVTDVLTGKGYTADKELRDGTSDFGVRDTIYALVKTDGAATGAKLSAKWTYNGKQTVKESSENISSTGAETKTQFHVEKKGAWPKGNYKVEVMLDGAPAGSKDFTIK